jgi:signal transduction histidine kinase
MLVANDSLFSREKVRQLQSQAFDERLREQEIEATKQVYRNRIQIYVLVTALMVFFVIGVLLWRNTRQKQKANALLEQKNLQIENTLQNLKATQAQLIQSEKMASLGELTAGIAHEIQNPLNFVNNFSETNVELLIELKEEISKGNLQEVNAIASDVIKNEQKINQHGKRAENIVKGMLEHSRTSKGEKQPTDINKLTDEYLRLAYHGFRAKDKNFNAKIETNLDESIGKVNIVPQEIGRVLLNLFNNAFYAVNEKKKQAGELFEPKVEVSTKKMNNRVEITVKDNGNGIPQQAIDKVFQPFFTTKPTGQGTGLGLSLSYDIVKAHGGELRVESKEEEGSSFTIELPA